MKGTWKIGCLKRKIMCTLGSGHEKVHCDSGGKDLKRVELDLDRFTCIWLLLFVS
jgi:hypothetical protein